MYQITETAWSETEEVYPILTLFTYPMGGGLGCIIITRNKWHITYRICKNTIEMSWWSVIWKKLNQVEKHNTFKK